MASSLHECSHGQLKHAQRLVYAVDVLKLARHPKRDTIKRYYGIRLDVEARWVGALGPLADQLEDMIDVESAYNYARDNWKTPKQARSLWIRKETNDGYLPPEVSEVAQRLVTQAHATAWEAGAVQTYIGMALYTGEQAGQMSLDMLGLNKTFAWAHPRNMASDLFAVRGSKVIQNMYGEHLNQLARIITTAVDPRNPLPIQAVREQIRTQWPDLRAYQVNRIARTETAAVWSRTAANAYAANGITQFDSLVATRDESQGSTLIETEDPCDECVEAAANGPYSMDDDIPPWHPNCRCEVIPVLENEDGDQWLPPAETWAGGNTDGLLPTESFSEADAAYADLQDEVEG